LHPTTLQKLTGNLIRRLRELQGISQGDLARMSEANLSYISSIESGKNNISIGKLFALSNALRLSPSSLVNILVQINRSILLDRDDAESADEDTGLPLT
jgi:transcriptional regulator with XRE-family HTH domain